MGLTTRAYLDRTSLCQIGSVRTQVACGLEQTQLVGLHHLGPVCCPEIYFRQAHHGAGLYESLVTPAHWTEPKAQSLVSGTLYGPLRPLRQLRQLRQLLQNIR